MKTNQTSVGILALRASGYGAVEIKKNLKANTFRGFAITTTTIGLFLALYWGLAQDDGELLRAPLRKGVTIIIDEFGQHEKDGDKILPPPLPPPDIRWGPASRGGAPVPVPDAQITPDMQDFAVFNELSRAMPNGGDGIDPGNLAEGLRWTQAEKPVVDIKTRETMPEEGEFVPFEKEPAVDLGKLQSLVIYPQLAIKANVEGKVTLNVLVDTKGEVRDIRITSTENILLNDAAIQAVKKYGRIPPAVQNGQPIACWVAIPISFKLK